MKLTQFHLEGEKTEEYECTARKIENKKTLMFFSRKTLVKINAIPQTRKKCIVHRWFTILDMENTHQKTYTDPKPIKITRGNYNQRFFFKASSLCYLHVVSSQAMANFYKVNPSFQGMPALKEFKANLSHLVGSIPSWTGRNSRFLLLFVLMICFVLFGRDRTFLHSLGCPEIHNIHGAGLPRADSVLCFVFLNTVKAGKMAQPLLQRTEVGFPAPTELNNHLQLQCQ